MGNELYIAAIRADREANKLQESQNQKLTPNQLRVILKNYNLLNQEGLDAYQMRLDEINKSQEAQKIELQRREVRLFKTNPIGYVMANILLWIQRK